VSDVIPLADFDSSCARVVEVLRGGGLAVVPTDTVYAVVADAFQLSATQAIFAARGAGRERPLTLFVRSPRQVDGFVDLVPETAERLMAAYWPGPLTLVFPAVVGLGTDLGDTRGTVALRMPADELCLALIGEVGPLAATAANRPGLLAPSTVADARAHLGAAAQVYVDGGVRAGTASTIVDVGRDPVVVLRDGAVALEHVHRVAAAVLPWGRRPEDVVPGGDEAPPESEVAEPERREAN
jgi:L-threonylcarbamoyladenylate synthase